MTHTESGQGRPGPSLRVLYAGDGPIGGASNYLLAVLRSLGASVRHLAPAETLSPQLLTTRYDAIILSDFPAVHAPATAQRAIAAQVACGTGLLMVGGWGSFSGPCGGWRGTLVERLLPVACRRGDDRVNFPGGALIAPVAPRPVFGPLSFRNPPMICGLNAIRPRSVSRVVLSARPLQVAVAPSGRVAQLRLGTAGYPLLVVGTDPRRRVAALATDLAPHWCGGLVDWGARRLTLPVQGTMRVEVGDRYVTFVASLIRWLGRSTSRRRHHERWAAGGPTASLLH